MPIVTISRMYGSGGSVIAERVAEALGWSLLDNALVERVAEGLGITPEAVEARQERVPPLAERLADTFALGAPEFAPAYPTDALPPFEERLLAVTQRVIEDAIARGPVVVVGRGAQAMLARSDDALHVFCYAGRDALVARAAARLGTSAEEAARVVDETNKQRTQYVQRYWRRSWTAHENYDLCVNTGRLGTDGAADLVLEAARRRFPSR